MMLGTTNIKKNRTTLDRMGTFLDLVTDFPDKEMATFACAAVKNRDTCKI